MRSFLTFFCLLIGAQLFAAKGYEIKVSIDGFTEKEAYLGYHYGDKQYISDTTTVTNGKFEFSGNEPLDGGMYLIVLPPNNDVIQILINEGDQHLSVKTKIGQLNEALQISGSKDNTLFNNYTRFLNREMRPLADSISQALAAERENGKDETKIKSLENQLKSINEQVVDYQNNLIKDNPKSLTAAIVKANLQVKTPEFEGDQAAFKRWQYTKHHFFDNIDLADPRFLKSPVVFGKVDYYMNKLIAQHPDSIKVAVDYILDKTKKNEDSFKFFLIHFLNTYSRSKMMGMDAVFVHVAEKYYATGQAPWTPEENLEKIVDKARKLKPLLIGKVAPDITCELLDVDATLKMKDHENIHARFKTTGTQSLHGIDAKYTVLFIWAPDCGHCKKSMPKMIEFYDEFKDRGVEVFAVCSKFVNGLPECAEFMDKNRGMLNWINVVDPYHKSKYKILYDVESTPQVYILDEKKEIILKRVGAEQISEVMEDVLKQDTKTNKAN